MKTHPTITVFFLAGIALLMLGADLFSHTGVSQVTLVQQVQVQRPVPEVKPQSTVPSPSNRQQIIERVPLRQATPCDCYWRSDCGSPQHWVCNYGSGCAHSGKLDGRCQPWFPFENPKNTMMDPTRVAGSNDEELFVQVLDLWFKSYVVAAEKKGNGLPDHALLDQALVAKLSDRVHVGIKDTVFNVIDVLAGFDFAMPPGNCYAYDTRCLGFFRIPLDPKGVQLLEAGERGFVEALRAKDRRLVERALQDFWKNNDYRPHHTGRCYPHGHAEFGAAGGSPLICQRQELGAMVDAVLAWLPPKRFTK